MLRKTKAKARCLELIDESNWAHLIQDCDSISSEKGYEREDLIKALEFLRNELGSEFLLAASKENHPLFSYIVNRRTGWGRRWLPWFAEALKATGSSPNYGGLLERVKDRNRFDEAISVLEAAYGFISNGFQITFDPRIDIRKKPDFKAISSEGSQYYVEVSILGQAERMKEASNTMDAIAMSLFGRKHHVFFTGQVHKILGKHRLEDILHQIDQLYEKSILEMKAAVLEIPGVIDVGIVPAEEDDNIPDEWTRLREWARTKGIRLNEFGGPGADVNDVIRLRLKIREEQKQLPLDKPSIIVINAAGFFMRDQNIDRAITELEEEVYNYSNLVGVLITGHYILGEGGDSQRRGQHFYTKRTWMEMGSTHHLILLNNYCGMPLDHSMRLRLCTALISL